MTSFSFLTFEKENDQNSSDSEDEYFANNNHTFKRGNYHFLSMDLIFALLENGRQIYLGIHDILTHYDTKKKAANAVKTAKHGVSLIWIILC